MKNSNEKFVIFKNRFGMWLIRVIVFCVLAMSVACQSGSNKVDFITPATPDSLLYTYFSASATGDTAEDKHMSLQRLWNCIGYYCNKMHVASHRYDDTYSAPPEYTEYRKNLCMGDMFMQILDSVQHVEISNTPSSVPDEFMGDFSNTGMSVADTLYCAAIPVDGQTAVSMRIEPLETVEQRDEIREVAIRAYYSAIEDVMEFVGEEGVSSSTTQGKRNALYLSPGDKWFAQSDPNSASGEALANQMFASLSTLVETIKNTKVAAAEERMMDGAAKGEQWSNLETGRPHALKHLWGNYSCADDQVRQPGTNICWDRCLYGQKWDPVSQSCAGEAVRVLGKKGVWNGLRSGGRLNADLMHFVHFVPESFETVALVQSAQSQYRVDAL